MASLAVVLAIVLPTGAADAHPLGNFTINTYTGLRIQPGAIVVDLVVDMAEIPAVQARRVVDHDGDQRVSEPEAASYASRTCRDAAAKMDLESDGRTSPLRAISSDVTFPEGAAGLPTLRLTCGLIAETRDEPGEREIELTTTAFTDRVGWREITAVGDRTTVVRSNVARDSISRRLTAYPDDLLSTPPDQRGAIVRIRPGGPAAPTVGGPAGAGVAEPRGLDGATRRFAALVARQRLSVGFTMLALATAVGLGSLHAFAPGHGKTVMAAYLVGERGSLRQAALLGLTVTAAHTVGVLVLGIVLSVSTSLAPEAVYPWLGLASGLLLAGVGAGLLLRATHHRPLLVAAESIHMHDHGHDHHGHDHHHGNSDGHHGHHHHGRRPMGWPSLVPLGLAGGLVPSPSAVVVLLGAIALGRAWLGVALVIAYGMGMALTLMGAGLLLIRARDTVERLLLSSDRSSLLAWTARRLPTVTAACIVVAGVFLMCRGATQL